jgi:hypothetical protein
MPIVRSHAAGEPWSDMDLVDLQSGVTFGTPVKEIADFLERDVEDVRRKIAALSLTRGPRSHVLTAAPGPTW